MAANFVKNMEIKKIVPLYVPFFLYSFNLSVSLLLTKFDGHNHPLMMNKKARIELEDVPIDGSSELDDDTMMHLFPYNLEEALEYNHAYLSGYKAEMYDEPKKITTKKGIDKSIASKRSFYGPNNSILINNTYMANKKIKYILLPVWKRNVEYEKENFKFYMNGQTKELIGKTNYVSFYEIIVFILYLFFNLFIFPKIKYIQLELILFTITTTLLLIVLCKSNKRLVETCYNFDIFKDKAIVKEENYK